MPHPPKRGFIKILDIDELIERTKEIYTYYLTDDEFCERICQALEALKQRQESDNSHLN